MSVRFPGSDVQITGGELALRGYLHVPLNAAGLVLFAHGSGSSRHSSRNQFVAKRLATSNIATLLLDLLTSEEERVDEQTGALRFDISLLAQRLMMATDWCNGQQAIRQLPRGYFGASTGAAAALIAAAERATIVQAVVSRGGRPDLAGPALSRVHCPVLFIVGGYDEEVLHLNRQAAERLTGKHQMLVIPKAGHLFEEPGALQQVADAAAQWFSGSLDPAAP